MAEVRVGPYNVHIMAKHYGLKSPPPIMCNTPESGGCMTMFQSGSKYYLWNPIMTSMDLVDIITQMDELGLRSLKVAEVPTPFWGLK